MERCLSSSCLPALPAPSSLIAPRRIPLDPPPPAPHFLPCSPQNHQWSTRVEITVCTAWGVSACARARMAPSVTRPSCAIHVHPSRVAHILAVVGRGSLGHEEGDGDGAQHGGGRHERERAQQLQRRGLYAINSRRDTGSEPQKPITPVQPGQDLSRPKMVRLVHLCYCQELQTSNFVRKLSSLFTPMAHAWMGYSTNT